MESKDADIDVAHYEAASGRVMILARWRNVYVQLNGAKPEVERLWEHLRAFMEG